MTLLRCGLIGVFGFMVWGWLVDLRTDRVFCGCLRGVRCDGCLLCFLC